MLVGCRRVQDSIRVEVWDTGLGIPFAKQKTVFREFERPANATSGTLYFGKSCSRLTVVKKRACQSTDMGEAGGRNEAMNRQEICGISVMYQTSPRGHCSTMPGCISAQTNHKIRVPE